MLTKHPIIQAPMAGAAANAQLVAAVSNVDALGSLGAAYMTPEKMAEEIEAIKKRTEKPYSVNLFVPQKSIDPTQADIDHMVEMTNRYRKELGIPELKKFHPKTIGFDYQFEVVLKTRTPVFSFVFGVLPVEYIKECKKHKIFVIGTATTPNEAFELVETDVDAICLQGFEAGGHRGIFDPEDDEELMLDELIEKVSGKIKTPIIAAGGLMSGKDIRRVLAKGAAAAQLGTAFLTCEEAGITDAYRRSLQSNTETIITAAFSGRPARGILNTFIDELKNEKPLPFYWQNALTRDIRNASLQQGMGDYSSLWAGTNHSHIRPMKAAEFIETLVSEMS